MPSWRLKIYGYAPWLCASVLAATLLAGCAQSMAHSGTLSLETGEETATTFAMNTLITQTAYGPSAQQAMRQVNVALADQEARLSLFAEEGDIAKVNKAAGNGGAEVSGETALLLEKGLSLSKQSEGAFALTVAPLTLAWGITGETPRVVPEAELKELLPLVNDAAVEVENGRVNLPVVGMGLDLGGIAKGAACAEAAEIYRKNGVNSALLSIGGNIYARGKKPDGSPWRVGFRDPQGGQESYIASFSLQDAVIAVSGGYERYFEEDGVRYIHILNPETGRPAESDILSVGAVNQDGATADFWSTTLFVWGLERSLEYMRGGGAAIVLASDNRLYVSQSLQGGFSMHAEQAGRYELHFVKAEGDQ